MLITETQAWAALTEIAKDFSSFNLREEFAKDTKRSEYFTIQAADLLIDISRQLISYEVRHQLLALCEERNVTTGIAEMFNGKKINVTEGRSVLHTALRRPRTDSLVIDGVDVVAQVHEVLDSMAVFAEAIRAGQLVGSTGKPISTVVNIGIGGSDLGPVMAYEALKAFKSTNLDIHFVSNVDGADILECFKMCNPETTMFIVASKTFTTSETMTNAESAKSWLAKNLGSAFDPSRHFVALSTNAEKVSAFGIDTKNMFGFWDWVGGRFSVDSAIGLSLMISIGPDAFKEFLGGLHKMDVYVEDTPAADNAIILMAALSIWYRNFLGFQSYAVLPYDNYLKRLPAYLQQLIMESNGKTVTLEGKQVDFETSAVYWGEPGTNGQHSFHQLLHQGTTPVPVDFLFGAKPVSELGQHHTLLLANVLAQASVLAFGKNADEIAAEGTPSNLVNHKVMPGNRPSSLIIYPQLSPSILGQIIAMYEHITLVQGLLWGIGSFDQWGVELGKVVANKIAPALVNGNINKVDAATAQTVSLIRRLQN